MSYTFTVSPDFNPDLISGWFFFNTWLQKNLNEPIHLELYNDFKSQRQAIENDEIDLIYANPFDASNLVREKGFIPIACPDNASDEAIVALNIDSKISNIDELQPGLRISKTDDPDVNMVCSLMLEPANLDTENTTSSTRATYVLVAKDLITNNADVGFFLADTYLKLSEITRQKLKTLVCSDIHDIHHLLLAGPKISHKRDEILENLLTMAGHEKGLGVLKSLGFTKWKAVEQEDTEFMIDLMETLES